jgi:WD40 repeat protein
MRISLSTGVWWAFLTIPSAVHAQNSVIPPGDTNPVLRVEAGGPTSLVNSLAFSPDGQTLYAGGWDKVIRVWRLDPQGQEWRPAPAFRVPLGPGADGKINAITLSADGNWLAVAGSGAVRSRAGFRDVGIVVPSLAMSIAMREDQGVIYVFNVNTRVARVLRGHRGPVFALTFAAPGSTDSKDEPPPLVSAARERGDKGYLGAVWLWDTAKGTHEPWPVLLPDVGTMGRPGLATWRSDDKGLHVSLAWEDGIYRVWDVGRGKDGVKQQKDLKYNVTVATLPSGQGVNTPRSTVKILTGGLRNPGGYLQEWKFTADGMQRGAQIPDASNLTPNAAYLPLALTLLSSQTGKMPDHAAVALYMQEGEQRQIRLHLLDLDPARFGRLKADILLWPYLGSMPTLAAAPGGRYLAISDPEDQQGHGIFVYDIQDLLTKKNQARPWRLSSAGETFRYVSFVRGAKGFGLLLSETAKEQAGTPPRQHKQQADLLFDFTKPGFASSWDWQIDAPDLSNWQVRRQIRKVGKQEQSVFEVTGGDRPQTITLEVGQRVTEFALLPPAPPHKMVLLAVAVERFGEPSLLLYDASAGKVVRHFAGHDDTIRSLAFSSDGRLLVSAADDQTVCLWSLTDLPRVLGKNGLLTGLAVKEQTKGIIAVARVDKDSPAARKLAVGDIIEGLVDKEKLKPIDSARSFYTAIWERKPGKTIALQVAGKGRVKLPVDQAVDERQPLLTLYSTRGSKDGGRDWIAWSPQGPYADSGRQAERLLGWHINTGKPDAPASFAKAGEYRARYYKEGLLGHVVDRAALAPALEDLKKEEEARLPPDPRVLVRIDDEFLDPARADDKGYIAVQPRRLIAHVKVDDLPAELVKSVELSADGKEIRKIEPSSATEWSADLPAWQAGEHALGVVVRTPGGRRPEYTIGPLKVRYQPPAPRTTSPIDEGPKTADRRPVASIVFLPPPGGLTFYDEGKPPPEVTLRFKVSWSVDPATIKGNLDAVTLINGERQATSPAIDYKANEVTLRFKLRARDNFVQVRLSAPSAEPVTSEPVHVEYLRVPFGIELINPPPQSETPEVELTAVVLSPLPIQAKDISATVKGRPVQDITVGMQDTKTWLVRLKHVSLDGTKGSKSTVRLRVANADGMCRRPAECSIIYRGPPPKRPEVTIVAPTTALNVAEPNISVRCRVSSESPLKQLAVVNEATGNSQPVELSSLRATAKDTFEGDVDFSLLPGVNRLYVIARNEAGEQQSQTVVVSFLPPPVRLLLDHIEPAEGGQATALRALSDGRLNPVAPQGRLLLHGRVVWSQDRDERLKGIERVIVRVNGVQQVDAARLDPPDAERPRERSFQVPLFLSQPANNRVELELPGLPQEDADQRVYLAACARPVPEKRMLHLLILGISEKDAGGLQRRVLAALGATSLHGRQFALPAFDQALVYGPLLDDVRPVERTDVFREFLKIKKTMDALARKDLYTHVVMVYYQGNEVVNDKGYFLRTSGPDLDPSLQFYRIPFDNLEKLITETRGAQILLMDVAREASTKPANPSGDVQLFADSHAAVMRYAQLGKGPPGSQASLIGALEQSLRQASRLRRVEELVAERFAQLRKAQQAPLLYSRYIPPSLADLVIGAAPKQ